MHLMKLCFPVLLLCAAGLANAQEEATIYRWKNAQGQTSYGTHPPEGAAAEPIGGNISVVPVPPSLTPEALAEERKFRQETKLRELEADLESERRTRERLQQQADTKAACEQAYNVPCNDLGQPLETGANHTTITTDRWWAYPRHPAPSRPHGQSRPQGKPTTHPPSHNSGGPGAGTGSSRPPSVTSPPTTGSGSRTIQLRSNTRPPAKR